jgi:hypothetical protein
MPNRFLALLLVGLLSTRSARAVAPFEGTVVYRVDAPGKQASGRVSVRLGPAGARTEMVVDGPALRAAGRPGLRMTTIVRAAEPGRIYLVSEERRAYYVVEQARGEARTEKPLRIRATGADEVAGYPCDRARVEGEGPGHLEICVTRQLGPVPLFGALEAPDAGNRLFVALRREGIEGLPVRWIAFGADGKPQMTMVLESAKHERVPATVVALPEGYRRGDLGEGFASPGAPEEDPARRQGRTPPGR